MPVSQGLRDLPHRSVGPRPLTTGPTTGTATRTTTITNDIIVFYIFCETPLRDFPNITRVLLYTALVNARTLGLALQ